MSENAGKSMSQAELARRLGLSPPAVTKLKKLGMPLDSLESAQAWREHRQNVAQRKPLPGSQAPAPAPKPWGDGPHVMAGGRPVFGAFPMPDMPPDMPPDIPPGDEDRDKARTRREIAEANMAEISESKLRREVILVAAIKRQLGTDYATTRDALLQIPARMGPILAAKTDAAEVQTLLHAEIHQALEDLAGSADGVERIEGAFD